jgi:hypothetical protein
VNNQAMNGVRASGSKKHCRLATAWRCNVGPALATILAEYSRRFH